LRGPTRGKRNVCAWWRSRSDTTLTRPYNGAPPDGAELASPEGSEHRLDSDHSEVGTAFRHARLFVRPTLARLVVGRDRMSISFAQHSIALHLQPELRSTTVFRAACRHPLKQRIQLSAEAERIAPKAPRTSSDLIGTRRQYFPSVGGDGNPNGTLRVHDRGNTKHGCHVPTLVIFASDSPRKTLSGFGMPLQIEHFNQPLPSRLSTKNVFYGDRFAMSRHNLVRALDRSLQIFEVVVHGKHDRRPRSTPSQD
jgi:hypothetical protein